MNKKIKSHHGHVLCPVCARKPKAGVRLAAAAPALLKALKFSLTEWGQYDTANEGIGPMEKARLKAIRLAQRAIAKAEGRK